MRRLYIENETLLNLYIRPFLSGEVKLDDALAEELLNQIREANNEGYEDDLALLWRWQSCWMDIFRKIKI